MALVMGREHTGLSKGIASRCDTLVSLPMQGVVSSLNVSVATGICLYEIAAPKAPCEIGFRLAQACRVGCASPSIRAGINLLLHRICRVAAIRKGIQ